MADPFVEHLDNLKFAKLQKAALEMIENDEFCQQLYGIGCETNPDIRELKIQLLFAKEHRGNIDAERMAQLNLEANLNNAIAKLKIVDKLEAIRQELASRP